ncbi:FkbM family methyltransferase [Aminipila sp.]|uniref:FkbM family methyltransferase n=1 Tax=Aminipila sp. TaxID=2060095 RepID=UPI002898978C|nr:FkbM family methyltransferase [Aminipila sp.]
MIFNINGLLNYYEYFFENYDHSKKLFLFGAGGGCEEAINMFIKHNIVPTGIYDNDNTKWGKYIKNIPIISPSSLLEQEKESIVFVSAPNNAQTIIPQLRDIMKKNNIYFFSNKSKNDLKEYKRFVTSNDFRIAQVYNMLEDNLSKKSLETMVISRLSNTYGLYEEIYSEIQYFPENIINFAEDEILLDVGAYNGDTIKLFIDKTSGKYEKIIAVEPNSNMNKSLNLLRKRNHNIEIINKGAYKEEKKLIFNQKDNQSASAFSYEQSENGVGVDKLDNMIKDKISLIKMDIEGFELEALEGARGIIKKYRPKLAICIYHKYDDIVNIPEFIVELGMEYKLYIRHHSWYSGETVLYAI